MLSLIIPTSSLAANLNLLDTLLRTRGSNVGSGPTHHSASNFVIQGFDDLAPSHGPPGPKQPLDEADRMLALQIALKCSDIGSLAETLEVGAGCETCVKRWSLSDLISYHDGMDLRALGCVCEDQGLRHFGSLAEMLEVGAGCGRACLCLCL